MTDEKKEVRLVRWNRAELAWGKANADVHGLGEELKNLTPADPDREDHDERDYLITATEEKFQDAIYRVNVYIGDLPISTVTPAQGFQRALSLPLRGPGGGHESLDAEDDDDDD
ncbi:hypothetical protein [Mycolicibacterium tokaiense]|uniref:Uncharacterized protein n=1 Tax=Mycolicibacterium tokaiense TaxID=39695 RepID=A0A378TKS9_9MYCO|nr:hypothetical protein [Mycolicibacterium tokaiense]BBY84707.1 hypothetical protein MTOK_04890 [Mycolicibacterium tokaiense]STZ60787.1 Uncharacterised protein [Mycolicibacterium tokaiense]